MVQDDQTPRARQHGPTPRDAPPRRAPQLRAFRISSASAMGGLVRLVAVLAAAAGAFALLADDDALRAIAPMMVLLLGVQLYPLVRPGPVDLFEPPVIGGIQGAVATIASVAAFSANGSLSLRWLENLPPDTTLELVATVVLASVLGLVATYAGYYHPRWGLIASRWLPDAARSQWSRARLYLTVGTLSVLFAITYVIFQGRLGVAVEDATQLAAGKAVWRDDATSSWMSRGSQLGLLAALVYLAASLRKPGWKAVVLPTVLLLANAFLVSRLGQRSLYLYPLLVAAGLYHYMRRRISPWLYVGFTFAALILSNIQLQWRRGEADVDTAYEIRQGVAQPIETLAFHEDERQRLSGLALVFYEFPERHDHLLGETYLGLVATFVPRWLWPDKPNHFQWRDTMIIMRLAGAPVPTAYLGVLWVNWSWPGIVLGMFGWGVFQRATYEARKRSPQDPGTNLMYLTTLVFFGPTLLAVSMAIQYVLPAYVCIAFIGWRFRPTKTAKAISLSRRAR